MKCPICEKEYKNLRSVSKHIGMKHKLNAKETLFDVYPELFNNCKNCGKQLMYYKSDSQSRKSCNKECDRLSRIGKKQSSDVIEKRIKNTNQSQKEKTRQKTMLKRYNQKTYFFSNPTERSKKISRSLLGKKHTKEHHVNVIKSKRKNGTLNHTPETRKKISESLLKTFSDPSYDRSKFIVNNNNTHKNHKTCHYNGFFCRSSYEKLFIKFCIEFGIRVESAENKRFVVNYMYEDRLHCYYPDFWLPDLEVVIEIKPFSMLSYGPNPYKIKAATEKYNFLVITNKDGLLDKDNWIDMYKKIEDYTSHNQNH